MTTMRFGNEQRAPNALAHRAILYNTDSSNLHPKRTIANLIVNRRTEALEPDCTERAQQQSNNNSASSSINGSSHTEPSRQSSSTADHHLSPVPPLQLALVLRTNPLPLSVDEQSTRAPAANSTARISHSLAIAAAGRDSGARPALTVHHKTIATPPDCTEIVIAPNSTCINLSSSSNPSPICAQSVVPLTVVNISPTQSLVNATQAAASNNNRSRLASGIPINDLNATQQAARDTSTHYTPAQQSSSATRRTALHQSRHRLRMEDTALSMRP